jgi:stage 0 sporulation protein B (sporulation initiation phosphotransferase)
MFTYLKLKRSSSYVAKMVLALFLSPRIYILWASAEIKPLFLPQKENIRKKSLPILTFLIYYQQTNKLPGKGISSTHPSCCLNKLSEMGANSCPTLETRSVSMEKEWDIIEVLRHSRHDWLNRLQIIKGNLDLNRIDRAKEFIDEIIIEAQNETKLSNLPVPQFASLLLKSNWENSSLILEYEIFEDSKSFIINDLLLTNWTKAFFSCLNKSIEAFHENHLSITIEPQIDGVRFFFDFSGIIINKELITQFLDSQIKMVELAVKEFSENELAIEVFMPHG